MSLRRTRRWTARPVALALVLIFSQGHSEPSQAPTPKVGPGEVLVRVSVTDPLNRYVTDLEQKQFKITVGRAQQTISYFVEKAAPISVVFICDVPGGTAAVRDKIARLQQTRVPAHEWLLISFDSKQAQIESLGEQGAAATDKLPFTGSTSRFPLLSAVMFGFAQAPKLKGEKKAFVIVTPRASLLEAEWDLPKNPDFQVYALSTSATISEMPAIFRSTGGRSYLLSGFDQLDYYIDLVHEELVNQYVLGFVPSSGNVDLSRVKVEINAPSSAPKLIVHTQSVYRK